MNPDQPPPEITSNVGPPSWMAPVTPVVPDHEMVRRIGGGSYGDVWLARNVVGTWRAVKVVFRDRFTDARPYEREFNGIQKFEPLSRSNEGFIDILQIGRNDAEGYFYYVMELADPVTPVFQPAGPADSPTGKSALQPDSYVPKTLAKVLLQRGRLPVDECLELGITLNLALGHLHRAGLIHRDIKPSNIIFVGGVPKLADIGLVIETAEARSYVGTEGFIPPEGPTSPQADLYSLGKVLYEAGMGKDRKDFPEPFTQIAEVPDREQMLEFNAILLKACAASLQDRYQTAEEMNAELALLQGGGSVRQQRTLSRRLRFVQRAGALVTVLAAVITLGWWWQASQTRKVRELAAQKSQLAVEKTRLADNLAKLGEENRNRIVRLDIASGVRLLDEGDPAGALLWFADALPLVTNNPVEESLHRIRIQQTLNQIPPVLQVFPHTTQVTATAFSKDQRILVTGTEWGDLCVWDTRSGRSLWPPLSFDVDTLSQVRFTHSGKRVFASSLRPYGFVDDFLRATNIATVLETKTGRPICSVSGTNLLRADLSPDDRWLVTADTDHVIHVYDARDGKPMAAFKAHTDRIAQLCFSTNGNLLASSSEDHTVRLWHLPDSKPLGSPVPWKAEGYVLLSPDGALLATMQDSHDAGTTSSVIQTWDVATGTKSGSPIEMQGEIGALWFPPQRNHALFVTTSKHCALFDTRTHAQLGALVKAPEEGAIFSVSGDAHKVLFGGTTGIEGVWSLETGERLLPACLRGQTLTDANFSPDGSKILAVTAAGAVLMIPAAPLPQEEAICRLDENLPDIVPATFLQWHRFTPDRRFFLLILPDKTVRRLDFKRMVAERLPEDSVEGMRALQVTYDKTGRQGAIWWEGHGTNLIRIWSEANGTTNRFTLPLPAGLNDKFLFSPDGSRLLTPCNDGQIRLWKTADGTLERSIKPEFDGQKAVLFPDGTTASGAVWPNGFLLQDLVTGEVKKTSLPQMSIHVACFNPTGDSWASVGDNLTWSRIWSARTCEPLSPPLDHGGDVRWVDWSPDGKRVITAGLTPELKVWDASTGEQLLAPLRLGSKPLETGLWSLDGRMIVARSDENTVRVWDAATGEAITPVLHHAGYVRLADLVMTNRLVTLSMPNLIRAWDLKETQLPTDVISDYAKLVAGRRLNAAGAMLPLKPQQLADLSHSLHIRAPELFR